MPPGAAERPTYCAASRLRATTTLRSSVELFRGDLERGTLHGFLESFGFTAMAEKVPAEAWYNISTSQFISLCMFSVGVAILYRRGKGKLFSPAAVPVPA